jgi:hypothetical protein
MEAETSDIISRRGRNIKKKIKSNKGREIFLTQTEYNSMLHLASKGNNAA